MNIGFDAKRAFHNTTGLGNYSRTLIQGIAQFYPEHHLFLFNPKPSKDFPKPGFDQVHEVLPQGVLSKTFSSAWRSSWVKKDLKKHNIHLYHGLSHEIPHGMPNTGIASVVTIHDLIFERYPEQFSKIDVAIYHKKFTYACQNADKIIAISQQTKRDIIQWYRIKEDRIKVCYQSCNPAFGKTIDVEEKERIKKLYNLPHSFLLYVGSIIERKNLLGICKALKLLQGKLGIPLVVIGNGDAYKKEVVQYIHQNNLEERVRFLWDEPSLKSLDGFRSGAHLPAIYQLASCMIYPSFFEGFGIPVLEALWSRTPVITSNVSCLPETGGDAAYYVDPANPADMAEAINKVCGDETLRTTMIEKGLVHAQKFTLQGCTDAVMNVYNALL